MGEYTTNEYMRVRERAETAEARVKALSAYVARIAALDPIGLTDIRMMVSDARAALAAARPERQEQGTAHLSTREFFGLPPVPETQP